MSIKLTGDLESVAEDKVVTKSQYVSGGYMVLDAESDRNNLTDAVAPVGTLVYVADLGKIYQKAVLKSKNKSIEETWKEYSVSVDQNAINSNALDYIEENYQYELSDSDKSYINNYIDENMPSGGGSEGGVLNGYNYNSEFEKNSCARDEIKFENDGIKTTIFATYTQQSIDRHIFTPTSAGDLSAKENFPIDEGDPTSFSYYNDDEGTIICPLIIDNDGQVIHRLGVIASAVATEIFLGPVSSIGAIGCPSLENLYLCRDYTLYINEYANPLAFNKPVNIYVPRGSLFIYEPEKVRFDGNCMFHFEESANELQNYIIADCFDNCFAEYDVDNFPHNCSSYSFISRKEISIKANSKVDFQKDCMFDFSKEPIQTVIDKEDKKYTASFVNDEESISLSATYNAKKFLPAYTANYTIGDKEKTIDEKIKDVKRDIDAISDNIAKVTDNKVTLQKNLINLIHPVGSVILTRSESFDPTQVYPETKWKQWKDGYLKVGTSTEFQNEIIDDNGELPFTRNYKITEDMLPPHRHNIEHTHGYTPSGKVTGGNHRHKVMYDSDGNLNYGRTIYDWSYNESDGMYIEGNGSGSNNWIIDWSGDLSLTFTGDPGTTTSQSSSISGDGYFANNEYKPKFYPVYAWERID